MPSWSIHLSVAGKVYEKFHKRYGWLGENEFLFGNILPDLFEGHVVPGLSCVVDDYSTHFPKQQTIKGVTIPIPDLKRFLEQYQDKLKNSVIFGYYCHLFTDCFWNRFFFENTLREKRKKDHLPQVILQTGEIRELPFQEVNAMKQNDFRIFCQHLSQTETIIYPNFSNKILDEVKQIKEFNFTKKDIEKTIDFIHKNLCDFEKTSFTEYLLFSKEKMNQIYEKGILSFLNEVEQVVKDDKK